MSGQISDSVCVNQLTCSFLLTCSPGDLDLTMLCQLSRQGCVDAMLKDGLPCDDALTHGLVEILQKKERSLHTPVGSAEVAAILKKAPILPPQHYTALLHYIQSAR